MKTLALLFVFLFSTGAILHAEALRPSVYRPVRIMWNSKRPERWDEPTPGFKIRFERYIHLNNPQHIFRDADELISFIGKQKRSVRQSGFQIWWSCGPDAYLSDSEQKIVMKTARELRQHGFRVFLECTDREGFTEYQPSSEQ